MIFAPLILLLLNGEVAGFVKDAGRRGIGEAVVLLGIFTATTLVVFAQTILPLLFLPFLPMMVTVFRLGRLGAVMSTVILGLVGTLLTIRGLGPIGLIVGGDGIRAQFLQLYLATAVLLVLPAAAELKRRKAIFTTLQDTSALQQLILDRTSDIVMRPRDRWNDQLHLAFDKAGRRLFHRKIWWGVSRTIWCSKRMPMRL